MTKGKYIVIEGIDASGKSTQLKKLKHSLLSQGIDCLVTLEPGGTRPGQIIRKFLLDDEYREYQNPASQAFGYNYARSILVENILKPNLKKGKWALSDRSWLSTIAYQHFGEGQGYQKVLDLCEYAVNGCYPDQIFILNISIEEAQRRIRASEEHGNHYDRKPAEFISRLKAGYDWAAEYYSNLVTVIDGERDEETIAAEILDRVLNLEKGRVDGKLTMKPKPTPTFYFAGSITGGRDDTPMYFKLINEIKRYGKVHTEHLGDPNLTSGGEELGPTDIHDRDVEWLFDSSAIIAEVSVTSSGVGYEIGRVIQDNKQNLSTDYKAREVRPVLILYRPELLPKLTAMYAGINVSLGITIAPYRTVDEAYGIIQAFMKKNGFSLLGN